MAKVRCRGAPMITKRSSADEYASMSDTALGGRTTGMDNGEKRRSYYAALSVSAVAFSL
jgi:hypothetical protein